VEEALLKSNVHLPDSVILAFSSRVEQATRQALLWRNRLLELAVGAWIATVILLCSLAVLSATMITTVILTMLWFAGFGLVAGFFKMREFRDIKVANRWMRGIKRQQSALAQKITSEARPMTLWKMPSARTITFWVLAAFGIAFIAMLIADMMV
jgi:hypothetical protein